MRAAKRLGLIFGALALGMSGLTPTAFAQQAADPAAIRDFRDEQEAYSIGLQAFIYGYPTIDYMRVMREQTTKGMDPAGVYAPVNAFFAQTGLAEPGGFLAGRAPNHDTLYFTTWLDLTNGPVTIHAPDTADRYYSLTIADFTSEVQHTGRRTTGTSAQTVMIAGPGWQGKAPDGVHLIRLRTHQGYILGRVVVYSKRDERTARRLVEQFTIEGPPPSSLALPDKAEERSLAFFGYLNRFLRDNPRLPGEEALIAQFDRIGVGPSALFDASTLNEATKRGLTRAMADGLRILAGEMRAGNNTGWSDYKNGFGIYGFDYFRRASIEFSGFLSNVPEEAAYPSLSLDSKGRPLSGAHRYRMVFKPDSIPPVDAFWSITPYSLKTLDLIPNPIARYTVNDRMKGLKLRPDGSLELRIQKDRPNDPDVNWLPVNDDPFFLAMRLYQPQARALSPGYTLPLAERLPD